MAAGISGNISGTLPISGSPYTASSDITVPIGQALSIDPGVVIQMSPGTRFIVNGTLSAVGTAGNPIVITSASDGTPQAGPGQWAVLQFNNSTSATKLENVIVRYGQQIVLSHASPTFTNVSIATMSITAIQADVFSFPTGSGNIAVGCPVNGIDVLGNNTLSQVGVWGLVGIPYVIRSGYVIVSSTLTIAPGVVVKFSRYQNADSRFYIDGVLSAVGTSAAPIIFTSVRDDTALGDSDAYEGNASAAPGDWGNLNFRGGNPASRLDHVEVRYGGSIEDTSVNATAGPMTISNSRITQSSAWALRTTGVLGSLTGNMFDADRSGILFSGAAGSPSLSGNTFHDISNDAPIYIQSPNIYPQDAGGNVFGPNNTENGIFIVGNQSWTQPGVFNFTSAPYIFRTGYIVVASTLTIGPGAVLKFSRYQNADSRMYVDGTLIAVGTSGAPITFTSLRDATVGGVANAWENNTTPAPGDWGNINIRGANPANRLDHVIVRYGGTTDGASVSATNNAMAISNSEIAWSSTSGISAGGGTILTNNFIHDNASWGIAGDGPIASVNSNTFDHDGNGVYFRVGPSTSVVTGNTFKNIANKTMEIGANNFPHDGGGNVYGPNNGENGIYIDGNNIWNLPGTLDLVGLPYILRSGYVVATSTLTITAGVVVKFSRYQNGDSRFYIDGVLTAVGTSAAPIIFTSARDDTAGGNSNAWDGNASPQPGDWGDLDFRGGNPLNRLDHVEVRYGGAQDGASVNTTAGPISISNSRITQSSTFGLSATGLVGSLIGNTFDADKGGVLLSGAAGSPSFSGNTFHDISTNAPIYVQTANIYPQDGGGNVFGPNNTENGIFIGGNQQWTQPGVFNFTGAPYIFRTGYMVVSSTLSITPGVVLKFSRYQNGDSRIYVDGMVRAVGTSTAPVTFTSLRDATIGGVSNQWENNTSPQPGDWGDIYFRNSNPSSRLDFVTVRYGGSQDAAEVFVSSTSPTITNSQITRSSQNGIRISNSAAPSVSLNTISNNAVYAISVDAGGNPQIHNNNIQNNMTHLGVSNSDPGVVVHAESNYWGDPSGPSGVGPGHGDSVTTNVNFTPFLTSPAVSIPDDALPPRTQFAPDAPSKNQAPYVVTTHTAIRFSSVDDRKTVGDGLGAGVQSTQYSIDGGPFVAFTSTFTLSQPGQHAIAFFSTDTLGHEETHQSISVLSGTDLGIQPSGTLQASLSPYVAFSGAAVGANQSLSIEPGVSIRFFPAAQLSVFGTLTAVGTAAQPILFTSLQEGTTNAAPGQWFGLGFEPGSSASRLDHVIVRYGGASSSMSSELYINNSTPTISNSVISDSSQNGLLVLTNAGPVLMGNQFLNNAGYGVVLTGRSGPITGNTFDGNVNGMKFSSDGSPVLTNNVFKNTKNDVIDDFPNVFLQDGGGNTADTSNKFSGINLFDNWTTTGTLAFKSLPYIVRQEPSFGATGGTLTLAPGVVIKLFTTPGAGRGGFSIATHLMAVGTSTAPIIFTSLRDNTVGGNTDAFEGNVPPAPGDWESIHFPDGASGIMDHVIVRYGGQFVGSDSDSGEIVVTNSAPTISNSTITQSSTNGIGAISAGALRVLNNQITNNANWGLNANGQIGAISGNAFDGNGGGIQFINGTGSPTLTNNTFKNTKHDLIDLHANIFLQDGGGNTADDTNAMRGIDLYGGNSEPWTQSGVWGFLGFPYLVRQGLMHLSAPITIAPGVVMKFNNSPHLGAGQLVVYGGLTAVGTSTAPITFTSLRDNSVGGNMGAFEGNQPPKPGDWGGIYFPAGSQGILDHVNVRYGGAHSLGNILVSNNLTLTHSLIAQSAQNGVYIQGTQVAPSFTLNTFSGNTASAISVDEANAEIHFNNIQNNIAHQGVSSFNGGTVNAQNNYWGDPSGPGGVGPGTGDSVTANVNYVPFLTTPAVSTSDDVLPPRTGITLGSPRSGQKLPAISTYTPVGFAAVDDRASVGDGLGVGVQSTRYSIDGGSFTLYASTFTLPQPGLHTLAFFSADLASHVEATTSTVVFVDTFAPVTQAVYAPPAVIDSLSHPHISTATFISFSIAPATAAVASTSYSIDGGTKQAYAIAFALSVGTHTLSFQSRDVLNNLEALQSVAIYVDTMTAPPPPADTTPPTIQVQFSPDAFINASNQVLIDTATFIAFKIQDDLSGVATAQYRIDGSTGSAFVMYASTFSLTVGTHTIEARAWDVAGNLKTVAPFPVVVSAAPPDTGGNTNPTSGTLPDGTPIEGSPAPLPVPPLPPPPTNPPPPPPPPPPSAPQVNSVTLSPASPVGPGAVAVTIVFSKPMNNTVNPQVTWTSTGGAATALGVSNYVGATWTGQMTIPQSVTMGVAVINISGAQDPDAQTIPAYAYSFQIAVPQAEPSPSELTVTFDSSTGTLHLSWRPTANSIAYRVYRSTVPIVSRIGQSPIASVSLNAFTDLPPADVPAVYYAVTGLDSQGAETEVSTNVPVAMPLPPLIASPANLANVDISSTNFSGIAQPGVRINLFSGVNPAPIASVITNPDRTWFVHTVLGNGPFTISVQAQSVVTHQISASSATISINVSQLPLPPANFLATPGDTIVTLSWSSPTQSGITGFNIYRDGSKTPLNNSPLPPTQTTYKDIALTDGKIYSYVVTTLNNLGIESYGSSEMRVAPIAEPKWGTP